ncbi:hypothetical protein J3A83DRAFT_2203805 [Scleroderma citrinum]
MYIPRVAELVPRSLATEPSPFDRTKFVLNSSGVAGILGGEEAISSITMVHVFQDWRWLGWYNSPGSYIMGMRFARLARSAVPTSRKMVDDNGAKQDEQTDKLECGVPSRPGNKGIQQMQTDLATLFEYDGRKGPKFKAIHSGTTIHETGHMASLFVMECAELEGTLINGRHTQPVSVTIATLDHAPDAEVPARWAEPGTFFYALIPICVSFGTCGMCLVYLDWYAFSVILFGIFVNGISCLAIGSGTFLFTHPEPAAGCPPGDGILGGEEDVVILKGKERAVNAVTRGRFSLRFWAKDAIRCIIYVKLCSFLLVIQSIAQLALIPQCPLFGQLMFVLSLSVSWLYNLWLWSFDRDKVQRDILMDVLGTPTLRKFVLGTRTSMVVFVLLALNPSDPKSIMDDLLPSDTRAWQKWKTTVVNRLRKSTPLVFNQSDWHDSNLLVDEEEMLKTLFGDAEKAYHGFKLYESQILGNLSVP